MNYDSEILFVLTEAGEKGLSVKKIARHVFNNCNGLFDVVPFEDVYHYVACYLKRNSKSNDSIIERTSIRGVYRLNQSNTSRQLFFDFKSALLHIKTNLRQGGTLCFSSFLRGTCVELESLGLPGINYLTENELLNILKECGFEIEIFEVKEQKIIFENPHKLLKFFKDTGANSLVSYHWTPGRLKNFMLEYETRFKESDGVSLSWIPCYVKARLRN